MMKSLGGVVFVPGFNGSKMIRKADPAYNASFYNHLSGSRQISVLQWRDEMKVKFKKHKGDDHHQLYTVSDDIYVDRSNMFDVSNIRDLSHELENIDRLISKFRLPDLINQNFAYKYFGPAIDALKEIGLQEDISIAAVPYDFRTILLPSELEKFDANLKEICEQLKGNCNGEKTTLVCHSLGGLLAYRFLAHIDRNWLKDHIKTVVTISTPYGGVSSLYRCMISGYYYISMYKTIYGHMIREFSGFIACLPNSYSFQEDTLVFEQCSQKKYGRKQLRQLCEAIDSPTYEIQQFFKPSLHEIYSSLNISLPSEIPVITVYANGQATESAYVYSSLKRGLNNDPIKVYTEPGDGLVTEKSLNVLYNLHKKKCENYSLLQIADDQVGHTNIIMHPKIIELLKSIIAY